MLDRYRELEVPLDGIVQDWQYWGCDSNWNAMRFMNPHYINKMGDEKWMRYLPYDEDRNARYDEPRIKSPKEMVDYVREALRARGSGRARRIVRRCSCSARGTASGRESRAGTWWLRR